MNNCELFSHAKHIIIISYHGSNFALLPRNVESRTWKFHPYLSTSFWARLHTNRSTSNKYQINKKSNVLSWMLLGKMKHYKLVSASLPPQFGTLSLLPSVIPLQRTLSVAFLRLTTSSRPSAPPSGLPKCLRFGHWPTLCTINIYLLTYLLTYILYCCAIHRLCYLWANQVP